MEQHEESFKSLLVRALEAAKGELLSDGEVIAKIVTGGPRGINMYIVPGMPQVMLREIVELIASVEKPLTIIHVDEAWVAVSDGPEDPRSKIQPRFRPDREEAIIVQGVDLTVGFRALSLRFIRDEQGKPSEFKDFTWLDGASSRLFKDVKLTG
jgi:hypothetical protein